MNQQWKTRLCRIGRQTRSRLPFAILILILQSPLLVAATIPNALSDVRGFNYTPASAQRSWDMWLRFNAREVDRDFGYANELRLNQTRVFLPFGAWEQDPKTFSSSLTGFIDVAYQHHIGVMLVLVPCMARPGDANDIAAGDLDSRMQTWIKAVAEIVKDKPGMAFWNLPMPIGADDAQLQWKRGVPTVGVQGISARAPGGMDEYLDWAVPEFAELYEDTHDAHYLDVARVLLFDTKSMLALPRRTYDLAGPGWQQESWGMGPGRRGFGSHRSWLPWVSVNHLHGITGLEEFDPALYPKLKNGD